jgi:hypothetical protein
MKYYILLFVSLLAILISCKKDDEEEPITDSLIPVNEQWGLAINYTATWCWPCGNWGAPLIHTLADTGKVVAITVHANDDPMHNQNLYSSFVNVRTDDGAVPSFWIGDDKTTNISAMNNLLEQTPKAALAINSTDNGATISIKTKIIFYAADSVDYYLSVLILEDGIDGSSSAGQYEQNGAQNPESYKHDFVLRASSIYNNSYGEFLISEPAVGTTVEKEYVITLNANWTNTVYPVAILWRKNESGLPIYEFINAVK